MKNTRLLENTARWRKTKRGLVTNLYNKMKSRNSVDFQLEDLHKFAECQKFNRLFIAWEKSKYHKQLKPSIDRINSKYGYTLHNIQWLTWAENRYKQSMERRSRKGAVIQMLGDKPYRHYISQRQAVLETGLAQSGISLCLNGKRKTCGGYGWSYELAILGNIHENT